MKKDTKLRSLVKYAPQGVPEPDTAYREKQKREWLLCFDIANYLGISDKKILSLAKSSYRQSVRQQTGRGCSGSETWAKERDNCRKYYYVLRELPKITIWKNKCVSKIEAEFTWSK